MENEVRLDSHLHNMNPERSRNFYTRLISEYGVTVNGLQIKEPGKKIIPSKTNIELPETGEFVNQLPEWRIPIEVVLKSDDFIIINKAVGIKVHGDSPADNEALLNAVNTWCMDNQISSQHLRLLHRIDKPTSGLVLFSLTPEFTLRYTRSQMDNEISKYYLALVHGRLQRLNGKLESRIQFADVKHKNSHRWRTVDLDYTVVVEDEAQKVSLLLVRILNGKKHQIRKQFAQIKHPIVGDIIYGEPDKAKRLMLHAFAMDLRSVGLPEITFTKLPKDILQYLSPHHVQKESYIQSLVAKMA